MNLAETFNSDSYLLPRRLVICILAGLLIFYHVNVLYDLYLGTGDHEGLYDRSPAGTPLYYEYTQSALRVVIIVGLSLVASGIRSALWVMWAGIGTLVATHYWALLGDIPVAFTAGRHALSYLKGFIFPTIISLLMLLPARSDAEPERMWLK